MIINKITLSAIPSSYVFLGTGYIGMRITVEHKGEDTIPISSSVEYTMDLDHLESIYDHVMKNLVRMMKDELLKNNP